ncbi:MAG: hypothetical protein WBF33_23750, partial [Candidatus Nitrosopolaris sp.]
GEHITSRLVRTQNRELSFRCIAYNTHRITNLTIIIDGFYKARHWQDYEIRWLRLSMNSISTFTLLILKRMLNEKAG